MTKKNHPLSAAGEERVTKRSDDQVSLTLHDAVHT
jgi:hypothetical protein